MASEPHLTIIGFGMNDCWVDSEEPTDPSRISKGDFRQNMSYMIESLQSIDSKIILIAPNPLGTRFEQWRDERLREYVDIVVSIAEEYGTGLVNNNELFREYAAQEGQEMDDLLLDGLHPNDEGHKLIANFLVDEIKETMSD
jgi:lysophospholipase L1-like esterase